MKRLKTSLMFASIAIGLLTSGVSTGQDVNENDVRVMSFNIRLGVAKDGENHWDKRKPLVIKTITNFDADIVGTQETWNFQAAYLNEQLADYEYVGRSRQTDSDQGEQCGILFRKNRFDKLVEGHFWLSETPDQPGSKSWDSSLPRMVTWLKLWDRKNKCALYVVNTHFDHRGKTARTKSAELIRDFVSSLESDRVIITGDFNAAEDSPPYKAMFGADKDKVELSDSFRIHHPEKGELEGTFNGFKKSGKSRIDWIATAKGVQIQSAEIDRTEFEGQFPSDHFPVTAVVRLAGPK